MENVFIKTLSGGEVGKPGIRSLCFQMVMKSELIYDGKKDTIPLTCFYGT